MNSSRLSIPPRIFAGTLLALFCAFAPTNRAHSQTQQPTAPAQPQSATPEPPAAEADAEQKRLARARALAAIGKLAAAAAELESLRGSSKDESARDVARVLLMAIVVEMPDYPRALSLLDEAYRARAAARAGDAASHSYFAIAGQMVNAVRTHLDRYRAFGVNVADTSELPPEAVGDVEQLRGLLDRVVEQAKALHAEQLKGAGDDSRGLDAAALLEDAATVRLRIARHDRDRANWQAQVSEARQHLFSSEMRVPSISGPPAARPTPAPTAAPNASAPPAGASTNAAAKAPAPANGQAPNSSTNNPQSSAPGQTRTAAAPRTAGGAPVSVGSLLGKARQRSSPSYPQIARAARVSGAVTVYLVVNEKGDVESVERAVGPAQLQQAAAEAARRWKFHPTLVDGQPVRVSGFLSFNFAL